jgi:hypothetical protein
MTTDQVAAAFRDKTRLEFRGIAKGFEFKARAVIHRLGKGGRGKCQIIAYRTDGSSFSKWVSPDELHPIDQEAASTAR